MPDEFGPIQFVDEPPPATGKQRLYFHVAQQCRENPGKWAIMPGRAIQPNGVHNGSYTAFRPEGAFEAVNRKPIEGGDNQTYIRYVGLNPNPPTTNGETPLVQRSPVRQANIEALTQHR